MPPLPVRVRPLDEVDLPEVVRIENASFRAHSGDTAWSRKKFEAHWRRVTTRILVAEDSFRRVRGYLIWDRTDRACSILNLAVDPEARRRGVGWELLQPLFAVARAQTGQCPNGRPIAVSVPEDWLPAQLFFRASGFKAVLPILRDAYTSWIEFQWRAAATAADPGLMVYRSIMQGDARVVDR